MDNDRIEAIGHQVKGSLRQGLGRLIGDAKMTADGTAERAVGDAHNVKGPDGDHVAGIDTDRIIGVGHQIYGALRRGLGKVLGDAALQDEGAKERAAGKAQNAAGSARDEALEAVAQREAAIQPAPAHDTPQS